MFHNFLFVCKVGARGIRFEIETDEKYSNQYRVISPRIEQMLVMTNWEYEEAEHRFLRALANAGIIQALKVHLFTLCCFYFKHSPNEMQHVGERSEKG